MTRQKKEIIKKIDEASRFFDAEYEMGCGFGTEAIAEVEERTLAPLYEELARLRHYETVNAMFYDPRGDEGYRNDQELPFK